MADPLVGLVRRQGGSFLALGSIRFVATHGDRCLGRMEAAPGVLARRRQVTRACGLVIVAAISCFQRLPRSWPQRLVSFGDGQLVRCGCGGPLHGGGVGCLGDFWTKALLGSWQVGNGDALALPWAVSVEKLVPVPPVGFWRRLRMLFFLPGGSRCGNPLPHCVLLLWRFGLASILPLLPRSCW